MSVRVFLLAAAATIALGIPAIAQNKPTYGSWGYDAAAMDRAVKPGDDFFGFVNGAWYKKTDIAPDKSYVGIDSVLNDETDRNVRAIVEDMARNPAQSGRIGLQVGDFYASWMDTGRIEARGMAPLKLYLARITAAKSRTDLSPCSPSRAFRRRSVWAWGPT